LHNALEWLRTHPWQSTAAALAVALVAAVVGLVIVLTGDEAPDDPVAESTTTTTVAEVPQTTVVTGSTAATIAPPPPVVDGPGPFGTEAPEAVTAVVVDNVPDVGFQIGIDQAPLIIEVPVEGGLTRYTAMFGATTPDLIGPVRSLRPVSADLLALFRPIVFASGGQPFVTGMVESIGATINSPELSNAYQTLERPRPYHLFVTPSVEGQTSVAVGEPWEYGEWSGGDPAPEAVVPFAREVTWRFEEGAYVRYENGSPVQVQTGFETEPTALTRDTVILLYAHEKSAGYTDGAGAEVPTFDVIGSGPLSVYHQGEVIEGTWSRSSQAEPYVFTTVDGDSLSVPIGTVYWAVVPARPDGAEDSG
jgi:hypothetical protein